MTQNTRPEVRKLPVVSLYMFMEPDMISTSG